MIQSLKFAFIILAILLGGCKNNPNKNNAGNTTEAYYAKSPEFLLTGLHDESDSIMLRIAILGDAEPKPLAEFPNMGCNS